ncbi:MAG TPA: SDR family oxidoreductase [Chitinophagaceae bacterium]|nr:SDR family oxidoreductase [Chitinophagaceae bacterium]
MPQILLFGATGHLGRHIARELRRRGLPFTPVVRNEEKAAAVLPFATGCKVADVLNSEELKGICTGYDTVISALGKSVSPADRSKPSFDAVDLEANSRILEEAKAAGVGKMVYVSAFGAERHPDLTYFRVHQQFSERLMASGLDYAIIRPPALFSAFLDLAAMARQGRLANLGKGDRRTNPIWEGDVARICADALQQPNGIIDAGGPEVLTRREINRLIQQAVAPGKKLRTVPVWSIRALLPLIRRADRNTYDKLAFFLRVLQEDTIAPAAGNRRLEDYLREQAG